MLDDFGKKKAIEALEEAVSPLARENGGPLPKDRIRAAVNQDTLLDSLPPGTVAQ
jgi:hypothetical protein